jgi:hypothetical protein
VGRVSTTLGPLLVAVLTVSAACSSGDDDEDNRGPLALYPVPDTGYMLALLGGVVEIVGPCFYVVAEMGAEERTLIAFPEGKAVWDEGQQSVFLGGGQLQAGKPVTIGGGLYLGEGFDGWPAPPDESCDVSKVWLASEVGPTVN